MNRRFIGAISIVILFVVGLLLVASRQQQESGAGIKVSASFYPLGFFAQQILGSHGTVAIITPAGVEPHDYEPTPADIATMQRSSVVVLNGGGFEVWATDITNQLKGGMTRLVIAGDGLVTRSLADGGTNDMDPHIWLDPVLAEQEVRRIAEAIIASDPTHKTDYSRNEQQLLAMLDNLDRAYQNGLRTCVMRDIVTSHLSFGYLAERYQLRQIGIAGLSPDEEPSPATLVNIAQFVRDRHVSTIFFESLISPKLAQTIAQETGAKTAELNPIEGLTSDQISKGQNYQTVMLQNLMNLQSVLKCQSV
jgi:zinc transport system substrate-binding protein